jgi:hypothetical protein
MGSSCWRKITIKPYFCTQIKINNMRLFRYSYLAIYFLFFACKNEVKIKSNDTPEAVIRNWQSSMDNSDIKAAKELSSENTKKWLDDIEATFGSDTLHVKTTFISIHCTEENDSKASCKCLSKQEGITEEYEDVFFLVKENGKWVVDLDSAEGFEDDILPPTPRDSTIK